MTLLFAFLISAFAQDVDPRRTLQKAERNERRILTELNDVEAELYEVEREISDLGERGQELEQERMLNEDELMRAQAALDDEADQISGLIHALYRINRRGFARIVFSAEDPHDLRRRTRYLASLLRATEGVVHRFRDQVDVKRAAVDRVDTDRAALAALQAEVRLKEARLRDERARRLALLDEIKGDKTMALSALRERTQAGVDLSAQLEHYEAAVEPSGGEPFSSLAGKMRWPVSGDILRGYGRYVDEKTGGAGKNLGVTILTPKHTPVRIVADGVVLNVTFLTGYGQTIIVDHGDGFKTVYAHLGRAQVKVGKKVKRGDVIGLAGETGVTDGKGSRLHFEVRRYDTPQDPMRWLGSKS